MEAFIDQNSIRCQISGEDLFAIKNHWLLRQEKGLKGDFGRVHSLGLHSGGRIGPEEA